MTKEGGVPGKQNRHLPAFLLLFLASEDAHGGALLNRLVDIMPSHQEIDSGAVYRVLRELEQRGCTTSYWDTESNGPAKRMYHITVQGIVELELWYHDICWRKKNLEYFIDQYRSLNKGRCEGTEV